MKKIFLALVLLNLQFIYCQSIGVSGPSAVEVGISNNFTFTCNAGSYTGSTHFRITSWFVGANMGNGTIAGKINGQIQNTCYINPSLSEYTAIGTGKSITVPMQWGNYAPDTAQVQIEATIDYGHILNGVFFTDGTGLIVYKKSNGDPNYAVNVWIVCEPTISTPTVLDCCTNNIQFCASNYCESNSFTWSVTNGTIVSGQGTSCLTVAPAITGSVSVSCLVKRSSGLPEYNATGNRSVSRSPRSITFATNPDKSYICKGTGLFFEVDNQCGISSVVWTAPSCSISTETIVGTKRRVTISPLSTAVAGSQVSVYATVNYSGGCSAVTPSKTITIYESETPPIPAGVLSFTPGNGNTCNPGYWIAKFTPSTSAPFTNGTIMVDPATIIPGHSGTGPYDFEVCYTNVCNGVQTCKVFRRNVPAPCNKITEEQFKMEDHTAKVIITPNPSNGYFKIYLPKELSGVCELYEPINGELLQSKRFLSTNEINFEFDSKLTNGLYFLKVITDELNYNSSIILKR